MEKASKASGFKPCPKCFSQVDVVVVRREEVDIPTEYFFVNCGCCGEGTHKAFESVKKLQCVWNYQATMAQMAQ